MDIGYALAADHRDRVEALEVAEAVLPGVQASPPLFLPSTLNERLVHPMFNHLPTMNAELVSGREELFFGFIFDAEAGTQKLPSYAVRVYIDNLASVPRALLGSFSAHWTPPPRRTPSARPRSDHPGAGDRRRGIRRYGARGTR